MYADLTLTLEVIVHEVKTRVVSVIVYILDLNGKQFVGKGVKQRQLSNRSFSLYAAAYYDKLYQESHQLKLLPKALWL